MEEIEDARSAALEPIETVLEALKAEEPFPDVALRTCVERIDEAAPALLAVLRWAADGEMLSEDETTLLYRGLYVLGAARVRDTFEPLLRLLRREEDLEQLLGDVIFVGVPSILVATFDGDAERLFAAIAAGGVDDLVRGALLDAATFACWDGRIERDRMRRFLEQFHEERLGGEEDFAWISWAESIALLGFRELRPIVEASWHHIPDDVMELRHFDQDLRDAERAPHDVSRFKSRGLGYIDDVVAALEWTRPSEVQTSARRSRESYEPRSYAPQPIVNPYRNVGRNDPCPCGSGKKAKKCCLASA